MIRDLVVELVAPAIVGGARQRRCDDPPTLRPPSLRGQLRFWSRALGGDALQQRLWGTEAAGQRVRIVAARTPGGALKDPRNGTLGLASGARTEMVPPGDQVLIRFLVPDESLVAPLQAVAWVWLHLGAVGRRSRRGYGSLLWRPAEGDLLADWPPLWPRRHLADRAALEGYLLTGLERVRDVLGAPRDAPRGPSPETLATTDQVFVGNPLTGAFEVENPGRGGGALENAIHGCNEDHRGGPLERKQLGSSEPRLPSPILWRVFPHDTGYLPVMTWFPTGYAPASHPQLDPGSPLYRYLDGTLGFDRSLAGGELARSTEE